MLPSTMTEAASSPVNGQVDWYVFTLTGRTMARPGPSPGDGSDRFYRGNAYVTATIQISTKSMQCERDLGDRPC
jgi:hypothetical protein